MRGMTSSLTPRSEPETAVCSSMPKRSLIGPGQAQVNGGEVGGFGGGWLERPRRWLGTQWLGLALRVLSCPDQSHTLRRHRAELGHC